MPQLHADNVHEVRVGRRVELAVEADSADDARGTVERLAAELLANPLIESWSFEENARLKVGVVVFPGSNCDRDALHAATLVGAEWCGVARVTGSARR